MTREQSWLMSIGEAFSGMGGPVKAIRDASPQARHHFTQADQVNQLATARESDRDLGVLVQTAKGIGDNGLWRTGKLNGILYLLDVGSKTTSFSSACAGIFGSS